MSTLPRDYPQDLSFMAVRDYPRVMAIAREVRRHVRRESGAYCTTKGLCGEASLALSSRLSRAGIPNEIWIGEWTGPIGYTEAEESMITPQHTWVQFPQWDNAILDVTADQFSRGVGPILFPAPRQFYNAQQKIDPADIFEAAVQMGIDPEEDTQIPLRGPAYRRQPVKVREHLRRRVVEHLENPPSYCACRRSKTVDRVRRGLIRRLKR